MLPEGADFEWTNIEANNEIFAILGDGSMAAIFPLLALIYDFKSWFRQLAIDYRDIWKHMCHFRGGSGGMCVYKWAGVPHPIRPKD